VGISAAQTSGDATANDMTEALTNNAARNDVPLTKLPISSSHADIKAKRKLACYVGMNLDRDQSVLEGFQNIRSTNHHYF
jgi:hypothetical protein